MADQSIHEKLARIEAKLDSLNSSLESNFNRIVSTLSKIIFALIGIIASNIGIKLIGTPPLVEAVSYLAIFLAVYSSLVVVYDRKRGCSRVLIVLLIFLMLYSLFVFLFF